MEILYPTPLYLNQRHVFDTLAMIEDGFSMISSERLTQSGKNEGSWNAGGEVGLKNIFAFLPLSLKAEKSAKLTNEQGHEKNLERIHTPNSLFARLRENLKANIISDYSKAETSSIVEFRMSLSKNPLLEILESLKNIAELAVAFGGQSQQQKGPKQAQSQKMPDQKTLGILNNFVAQMNQGQSIDLVGKESGGDNKFILTIEKQFLNDPYMADLLDSECMVIGKVIQKITSDKTKINLLRHTTLGKVSADRISAMALALKDVESSGLNLGDATTEIAGPVLHILPTAIFV